MTPDWSKYDFTCDWFSQHLTIWNELLPKWRSNLRDVPFQAIEIGVYEGRSTVWIVENLIKPYIHGRLTAIDAWPGPEYQPMKQRFLQNMVRTGCNDKIMVFCDGSQVLDIMTEPECVDFIYVDGSHKAADVKHDTLAALRLVKRGGVVIWDDYCCVTTPAEELEQVRAGVKQALEEWKGPYPQLQEMGNHLFYWK